MSHRIRAHITGIAFLIGYGILTFSVYVNFEFALLGIIIVGGACSFGESVILGYLKYFPAKLTGAWSSGTGMAGVGACLIYLLLSGLLEWGNQAIFLSMIPTAIIYMISFEITWKSSCKNEPKPDGLIKSENNDNKESKFNKIKRCFMIVWYRNIMLTLVYIFEYVISVGLAQISNTNRDPNTQDRDYIILALCYQFGVLISRSSISICEIPYFGLLTLLQFINYILWTFHVIFNWFNEYIQFILMIYVGLLGGAMYVNVMYSILNDNKINKKDKEMCINITAIFINIGITTSAIIEIIMDNTFFQYYVNKSHTNSSNNYGCNTL